MPRINVKNIEANNYAYYKNALEYVARPDRCSSGYISATELYLPTERKYLVSTVDHQIQKVREYYYKTDKRLGLHLEINFSAEELKYLSARHLLLIGHHVATTEFPRCMTYFAVHDHTNLLHLDMLLVPINVQTGLMYGCNNHGWNAIEMRLRDYLHNFMPEETIGGHQVSYGMDTNKRYKDNRCK